MPKYLTGALLVCVLCWLLIKIRASNHRLARLFGDFDLARVQKYLEALTESTEPSAHVIFEDMDGSKRFVQFRRDGGGEGNTLTCHFPRAPWSQPYIEPLHTVLARRKLAATEVAAQPGRAGSGVIVVQGLRAKEAARLTDAIFRTVFGHPSLRVRVWGKGLKGVHSD